MSSENKQNRTEYYVEADQTSGENFSNGEKRAPNLRETTRAIQEVTYNRYRDAVRIINDQPIIDEQKQRLLKDLDILSSSELGYEISTVPDLIPEHKGLKVLARYAESTSDLYRVARSMAGLDSDEAWTLRDTLIVSGLADRDLMYSIAGIDSERAWTERRRVLAKPESTNILLRKNHIADVVRSLAGIDTPEAWEVRMTLGHASQEAAQIEGIVGLTSMEAQITREIFSGRSVSEDLPQLLAQSLGGLDDDETWELRKKFTNDSEIKLHVASGLAGLDSEKAWAMRDQLKDELDKSEWGPLALGLAGVDSERAWDLRREIENASRQQGLGGLEGFLLHGLAGLDSPRAQAMRERMRNSLTQGLLPSSLFGDRFTNPRITLRHKYPWLER